MAFSFGSYWNYGTNFCGLEYGSTPEGEDIILGLLALKKRDEFEIKKTFKVRSPRECAERLPKNGHAFLCITSDQVLLKGTTATGAAGKVVSSAFPNIDLNDFYFEILQTPTGNMVALCRKEKVKQFISSFEQAGIAIIGFSLGFFSVQRLLEVIPTNEITLSSYKINTEEKNIISFEKSKNENPETKYIIGDSEVSSEYLLTLSALFGYVPGHRATDSNFENRNVELKKAHHQKVFFRKGMVSAVIFLFAALLINFLLFSNYYEELQQMTARHQAELSQRSAFDKKLQDLAEKEKTVAKIFNNSNSKSSFYLNRIIGSKPGSIVFTGFTYQPLKKQVKEKVPITLDEKMIRIAGESKNESEFSIWVKELEEITWIEKVKVANFSYSTAGHSQFILNLKISEDETGQ